MYVNVETQRNVMRKLAQEWLVEAEKQKERKESKNYFIAKSGKQREKEALFIAQQLMEIADGRRGILARVFKRIKNAYEGKRRRPFLVALGGYGAKVGGFIKRAGTKPFICLAFDRDFNVREYTAIWEKVDFYYGD